MKRLGLWGLLLIAGFLIVSCGDDDDGVTTGGSGETSTAAVESVEQVAPAAAAAAPPAAPASKNFSLLFEQTTQACADCGVWFQSAELVVQHTGDNNKLFKKYQAGNLLIKQSPMRVGRFEADLSSIPASSTITQATLYMLLDPDEGIANADNASVITVYDFSGGTKGGVVRTITAAEDIKGKGYSKANPNVPIDFTAYASKVHSR